MTNVTCDLRKWVCPKSVVSSEWNNMKNSLSCVSYYINWEGQPEGGMEVTEPMMISENSSSVYGQKDFVFFTAFFFSLYTQIGRKRQISLSRRWVSSKCERERWQSINLLLIVICMRIGLWFSFEFEFVFELRMRLGHTQLVLLPVVVVSVVLLLLLLSFNGVLRWHNNILLCILLFAVLYFFLAI